MKKIISMLAIAAITLVSVNAKSKKDPVSYAVSVEKSTCNWNAKKVTGEHSGVAKISSGTVYVKDGSLSGGTFDMDMTSIDATDLSGEWHDKLVGHLKSEDFFNVAKFPKANLVITHIGMYKTSKADENNYLVKGNLTIKGISKEVSFPAKVTVTPNGLSATATIEIDRTAYDIRYGSKKFFESIGDKAINDVFTVKVNIVAGN